MAFNQCIFMFYLESGKDKFYSLGSSFNLALNSSITAEIANECSFIISVAFRHCLNHYKRQ